MVWVWGWGVVVGGCHDGGGKDEDGSGELHFER